MTEPSILVAGTAAARGTLYRLFWNPVGGAGAVLSYPLPFALFPPSSQEDGEPRMLVNNNKLYITPGDTRAGVPIWSADFTQDDASPGVGPVWTNMCTLPVGIGINAFGRGPGRVDSIEQLWGSVSNGSSFLVDVIDLTTGALKYSIDGPPARSELLSTNVQPSLVAPFLFSSLPVTINAVEYMALFFFEGSLSADGQGGAFYLVDINTGAVVTNVNSVWSFTPTFVNIGTPSTGVRSQCKTFGQMSFDGTNVYVSAEFFVVILSGGRTDSYRLTQINCLTGAVTDLINTTGAFDDNVGGVDAAIIYTWVDFNTKLLYCRQRDGQHLVVALPGASGVGGGLLTVVSGGDDSPDQGVANQQYGYVGIQQQTYFDFSPTSSSLSFGRQVIRVDVVTLSVIDSLIMPEDWGVSNTAAEFNWAYLNCTIDGIVSLCVCSDTTLEFR